MANNNITNYLLIGAAGTAAAGYSGMLPITPEEIANFLFYISNQVIVTLKSISSLDQLVQMMQNILNNLSH